MLEMSLRNYLKVVGIKYKKVNNVSELSDYLNDETDGNLWAYSIKEIEYCLEENINVVIVKWNDNIALCELSEDTDFQESKLFLLQAF